MNDNNNISEFGPESLSLEDPLRNHTPKALEVDKPSSFLKQYSQALIDTCTTLQNKNQNRVPKNESKK